MPNSAQKTTVPEDTDHLLEALARQTLNTTPKDTDHLLEALAHHIRQQHPHHRVITEYSHEDYHFLQIYAPRRKGRSSRPSYCYINHETATVTILSKHFTVETHIDLNNPHSLDQFDQALSQLMDIE